MQTVVSEALRKTGLPDLKFDVNPPPREDLGDLSVSVAFQAAKALRIPPPDAAAKIAANIDISSAHLVEGFEAHPDGFINFRVNLTELTYGAISEAIQKTDSGSISLGGGKRVLIEHTSVNPNKALHVGHLRNLVIGDCVARVLRFVGNDVSILNYVDDSGLQVADLLVGFLRMSIPLDPPSPVKYDHYCGDTVYVRVNEAYAAKPDLLEDRRRILLDMENADTETAKLAKSITLRVLSEQLATCWRMDAHYDLLNFESQILETKLWDRIFNKMKEKGVATLSSSEKYSGCWIIRVEGEEEGEEKVLLRSNGTATYIAKDIPYAAWKIGLVEDPFKYRVLTREPDGTPLWATTTDEGADTHPAFAEADLAITVIDRRQSRLQRIISHALGQLGGQEYRDRYRHLGYALVNLSAKTAEKIGIESQQKGQVKMSGRLGIYVNADDVLDAVYQRALEETQRRNPSADKAWLDHVAEKLTVAAIRFELLKQDLEKEITFDLDESLRLEGETGPYLQYSYARACRILDKAGATPSITRQGARLLSSRNEAALLKHISRFDMAVEESARTLSPKAIARYACTLCTLFNIFYESSPVISAEGDLMMARLALVEAFRRTLQTSLNLLGIEALEKI